MTHRFGTKTETLIGYPGARVLSWLAKEMPGECAGYVLNTALSDDEIKERVRGYMNRAQAFHDVYLPHEVAPGQWFEFMAEKYPPEEIVVPFSEGDAERGFVETGGQHISIGEWFVCRQ